MCDCVEQVNEQLEKLNAELVIPFLLTPGKKSRPTVSVREKERIKGKKKNVPTLFCTYCPFCGELYEDDIKE
jgi:hypothetical protein